MTAFFNIAYNSIQNVKFSKNNMNLLLIIIRQYKMSLQ